RRAGPHGTARRRASLRELRIARRRGEAEVAVRRLGRRGDAADVERAVERLAVRRVAHEPVIVDDGVVAREVRARSFVHDARGEVRRRVDVHVVQIEVGIVPARERRERVHENVRDLLGAVGRIGRVIVAQHRHHDVRMRGVRRIRERDRLDLFDVAERVALRAVELKPEVGDRVERRDQWEAVRVLRAAVGEVVQPRVVVPGARLDFAHDHLVAVHRGNVDGDLGAVREVRRGVRERSGRRVRGGAEQNVGRDHERSKGRAEGAIKGGRIVKTFEERSSFASAATPDAVWRALCASGAFERDGSFPDAAYEKSSAGDDILVGRASLGPLPVEWEEPAWSWDPPHRFSLERRFRSGPFARYASETTIAPEGDGARIDQAVELEASGALGTLIAPLVLMRRRAVASAAIAEAVALAERGDAAPPAASAATVTRFVDAFDAVRPHGDDDVAVATHLAAHAEGSPDAVLAGLRPFALADAWGLPRERVAAAMLAAARAGLLDLRWQVTCEACGGRCAGAASLAALPRDARCAACNATCAVALDRSVEAVFDARGGERDDGVLRPAGPSATTAGEPRATAAYVTALQAFRDLLRDGALRGVRRRAGDRPDRRAARRAARRRGAVRRRRGEDDGRRRNGRLRRP